MERIGRERIIENFRIIINSLYEHQSDQENSKIVDELKKELRNINGDLKAEVNVTINTKDKSEIQKYRIEDVAFDGITLPEDVTSFEVGVDIKSRVRIEGTAYYDTKTVFRSMLFVMSENITVLKTVDAPNGIRIVNDMGYYSELTGDRIRFGESVKVDI